MIDTLIESYVAELMARTRAAAEQKAQKEAEALAARERVAEQNERYIQDTLKRFAGWDTMVRPSNAT